jgi:2-keto-4-pentenoate hydratase
MTLAPPPPLRPDLEVLARSLADAWRAGTKVALPPPDLAPRTRGEAFAVQDRLAGLLGARSAGWKVGAAIPAVRAIEGQDDLTLGRLFAERQFRNEARLPAAIFDGFKVECEIAFRFSRRVKARAATQPWSREELEPMVLLHAGLEIAGFRYGLPAGHRPLTTRDVIADNAAAAAYVEGEAVIDWRARAIDVEALVVEARVGGGEPVPRLTGIYYRDPLEVLVDMVNSLSGRGIDVAPGDLLSTGSLTVATALHAGQTFSARFGDLATLNVTLV